MGGGAGRSADRCINRSSLKKEQEFIDLHVSTFSIVNLFICSIHFFISIHYQISPIISYETIHNHTITTLQCVHNTHRHHQNVPILILKIHLIVPSAPNPSLKMTLPNWSLPNPTLPLLTSQRHPTKLCFQNKKAIIITTPIATRHCPCPIYASPSYDKLMWSNPVRNSYSSNYL